jgi:transcription antitermination factor NusG
MAALSWNAIYVNSRAEKKVLESLLKKGIEAYLPLVKTLKQWSDRKKMVEIPLLNGYVFVHISAREHDQVLTTKGVVAYVKYLGKNAVIRDHEIERLKQLVDLGYQMEAHTLSKPLHAGDKIKIVSGPLRNVEGFVIHNEEGRFIEVALESIGQSIRVKLPGEIILPV